MRARIFYAAKINIHGNIFSQNLDELINEHIPRVLINSTSIKINTWNWSFTDVERKEIDGRNLVVGNLTKSKYTNQKVKLGQKTAKIKSNHEIAQTAFFAYDINNEILVYEKSGSVDHDDFKNVFIKLLSSDYYVGEVKIIAIPEPQQIRKELLSIEKFTQIKFQLIHPNPGREEFNMYQELIDEVSLKELDISMKNKDGFEIRENDNKDNLRFKRSIENGISLVESGYGDIDIKGFDEYIYHGKKKKSVKRRNKRFTSRSAIRNIKISESDNKSLLPRITSFIISVKDKKIDGGEVNEPKK